MWIEAVILGLFAAAASTIALWSWRTNRKVLRRIAELSEQREKAESDKASLTLALALRESEENERISRLEHDVKSSLGVILGFSALLRELVEHDPQTTPIPLKSINGIQQAAKKILHTIEAAVEGNYSRRDQDEAVVEGKN
jgi:signal transduction histidine kinase